MCCLSNIENIKRIDFLSMFMVIEMVIFTFFSMYNLYQHGEPLNALMLGADCQFNDYFMHIGYASAPTGTNIYEFSTHACFPPLAYLMYGFLARIVGYSAANPTDISSHQYVGNNLTIYLVFTVICIVLFLYAISLYIKKKGFFNQVIFPCLLIVSYPFALSSLQRGNSVLIVAVLICIAIIWRNEKSKMKRELAMVIIAICTGLKIYPALLGLLYIKEKRIFEAVRLVLYGLLLFFVPFVFFGGVDGIRSFVSTVFILSGEIHRCSVSGFVNAVIYKLFGENIPIITLIVQQMFLILSIITFFFSREKWGEILILCCVMTVYISSSWMYTCIYVLPAALMFFSEKNTTPIKISKNNWIDFVGFVLFIIVFSIPYKLNYIFIYDAIIIFATVYIVYTVIMFVTRKTHRNNTITVI